MNHRITRKAAALWLAAAIFVLLAPLSGITAEQAKSISFPAISADGETVYFSYWGDIWSAPADGSALARRLTDNVAYDARPTLSPDGGRIAFLSDRFGNFDIFVMPEQGGEAQRLTWDSAVDYPYDWNRDGSAVLAYTMRQDLWGIC
ncbi:MAG TPA: peptidase S41, partial [Firmicutes bacterium]|nr:peptidase S41 [Bacillota bacterium]